MQTFPWPAAFTALMLLCVVSRAWARRTGNRVKQIALPEDWALESRPVFSTDERQAHRLLREALPQHIVLSKLPLVRFCQPTEPDTVRYWFDLLGAIDVTFAVCSTNGRVLAAIDFDTDRSDSARALKIKQAVLSACRVRYLRCPIDSLPSTAELQWLMANDTADARASLHTVTAPFDAHCASREMTKTDASHPTAPYNLGWRDSTTLQNSFFVPNIRAHVESIGTGTGNRKFIPRTPTTTNTQTSIPDQARPVFSAPHCAHSETLDDIAIDAPRFSAHA